ncbi:unnamed protein product [Rhizoctonia solani]|uniref:Protein kinase domain-containing protein n=1 Tax=Rhizoctonia solani TaxID=456999 RepID=A0A8H3HSQ3_9AGAM|nr:unnamed protein product [Rhizoctonia solani]
MKKLIDRLKKLIDRLNTYVRDRGRQGPDPLDATATVDPIVVAGTMVTLTRTSIEEVLSQFVKRGCTDLTSQLEAYQIGRLPVLGGGFGDVYCGTFPDGHKVALKCLRLQVGVSENEKRDLKRAAQELHVWSKCQHPNILQLMGVANHDGRIAMVSLWMENGDIRWFLSQQPRVNRFTFCVQVSEAVVYLHEQNIVHGDIKGSNILVSKDCVAKLTDFGSANIKGTTLQLVDNSKTNPGISIRWAAPEVVEGTKCTAEGDIYALGMTILEIITCLAPYTGLREVAVINKILQRILPERPVDYIPPGHQHTDHLWLLLLNSWKSSPADRPIALHLRDELLSIAQAELGNPVLRDALNALELGENTTVSTTRIQSHNNNLEAIDRVGSKMTLADIMRHLVEHGCKDLTLSLDLPQSSELPLSSSDFRDTYRGILQNGTHIQLETLRFRAGMTGDRIKLLKHTAHEIYVWSKCKHVNILELLGVAQYHGHLMMVSPWVEQKDLIGFLSRQRYTTVGRLEMCTQVASAVAYLHDAGIVHGDIRASNVIVLHDEVKLAGFGNMALRNYTLPFTPTTHGLGIGVRWAMTSEAPEIIEGKTQLGSEADVYALGMTILEIITGSPPYAQLRDVAVFNQVTKKIYPNRPLEQIPIDNKLADLIWSLLKRCWSYNPKDRPDAASVCQEVSQTTDGYPVLPECAPAPPTMPTSWNLGDVGLSQSEGLPGSLLLENEDLQTVQIMDYLANYGCRDITDQLDMSNATILSMSSYGRVDRAKLRDGSQVQIRRLGLKIGKLEGNPYARKRAAIELSKWFECKHPHVLAFAGVARYYDEVAIISPWMEHGELSGLLRNAPEWLNRFVLINQIADAVVYLHKRLIVHGDIRAANVLISKDRIAFLTGFEGIALEDNDLTLSYSAGDDDLASHAWAAPEILLGHIKRSTESDIYSLGMTILEIITGVTPYYGTPLPGVIVKVIHRVLPRRTEEHFPFEYQEADMLWSLLVGCWRADPSERPNAEQVLSKLREIPSRDLWVKY